jgi:hypothetical protein
MKSANQRHKESPIFIAIATSVLGGRKSKKLLPYSLAKYNEE